MHFIKLLFLSLICSSNNFAQISFFNAYTDKGYDIGEGIVQLQDSSYLVTGASSSFTENSQAFILKIDSLGNRLWSNHYGGNESDKGKRIFYVENDGIYVAGQTNSFGNFFDAYFFKTDISGNLLFEKNYGSNSYEEIHDAIMLKDTSFILVGETSNSIDLKENIFILRINKNGDTLWTKNYGSIETDQANAITLLNDTTVIIAGEMYNSDSLTQKAMLMSLDINGTINWIKTYGNEGKHTFNDLSINNDEIRAVGHNYPDPSNQALSSQFMALTDIDGIENIMYSEIHQGSYSFQNIVKYGPSPSNFYFVSKVSESPDIPTYPNGSDIVIFAFDKGMYYQGTNFIPSDIGNDISNEMIATSDGGAILVGYNENPAVGGKNVILVKIGPNNSFPSLTVNKKSLVELEKLAKNSTLHIFPNPTKNEISLSFHLDKYIIFNELGEIVLDGKINSGKINVSHLNPGIYFLNIDDSYTKFIKE